MQRGRAALFLALLSHHVLGQKVQPVIGTIIGNRQPKYTTESTYTTDCDNITFTDTKSQGIPPTAETCIWTKDGLCFAGTNKFYKFANRPNASNSGLDGSLVNITVDYIESLPADITIIQLTNLGIKRLNRHLDVDIYEKDRPKVSAQSLILSQNLLTSIENISFPPNMANLSLAMNNLGNQTIDLNQTASLKLLDLSANRIGLLHNLTLPYTLEILILAANNLTSIDDVSSKTLPFPPTINTIDLSQNSITKLINVTWPTELTTLFLDGNNIEELYLRFPIKFRHLCIGQNPIKKITATKKMVENLRASATINDVKVCGLQDKITYPAPTCRGVCESFGGYQVTLVYDPLADSELFNIIPKEETSPTLYISIVIFCVSVLIVGIAYSLEMKRRERMKLEQYWLNTDQPGHHTIADSAELYNDIRYDPMFQALYIPPTTVSREKLLARGGYGIVYLANWTPNKGPVVPVALKRLLPERLPNVHNIEDFMDEIRLCSRLHHPNIVTFYGYTWATLHSLSMLCEYMSQGDLWTLLENDATTRTMEWNIPSDFQFEWTKCTTNDTILDTNCSGLSKENILRDVVSGLVYLHGQDIIHRDLKAKNVLINGNNIAKLTDFGTSRSTCDETMTAEIGTVAWIAPEILKGIRYSAKADIYSLGVLMAEMDTMEVPYTKMNRFIVPYQDQAVDIAMTRIAMLVVAGELQPSFSTTCPSSIYELAKRCLTYNPEERPNAIEILGWLNQLQHHSIV